MNIDLRNLDEASGTFSGTDRVEFTDALDEPVALECAVEVRYTQTGGAYYLTVRATAGFETSCHRCLEPVTVPLEGTFELVIRRGVDRALGNGEAVAEGDFITVGANEHDVSLHPFIHENVVVSIPMLILCSDDCKGLCPACGENRNRVNCGCSSAGDSRWDALRHLSGDSRSK